MCLEVTIKDIRSRDEMKIRTLIVLVLILSMVVMVLFFSKIDSAVEIDSLKEQVKLQRREMQFLQGVINSSLSPCKITVADFESWVRANGRDVSWRRDDALVGSFRIKKNSDLCLVRIEAVVGL